MKSPRESKQSIDSTPSFLNDQGVPIAKPLVRYAWAQGNSKVNEEVFHRMRDDYHGAKRREGELETKARQLAAQLARTEEAAKRALCQKDVTAKGGAAQKLLDAECALTKLRDENAELRSKLSREKKHSADLKRGHDDAKARLDTALRDQRQLARKVGELEQKLRDCKRRPAEDEYWSEQAGRRFVEQQEQLVALREQNGQLLHALEQMGLPAPTQVGNTEVDSKLVEAQAQIQELTSQLEYYEKRMAGMVDQHPAQQDEDDGMGKWVLEEIHHDEQLYLLERTTSKMFTVPTPNSWPRPVGIRTGTQVKLGSNNSMDRFLNKLDNYVQGQVQELQRAFAEFDLDGSGQLDRRELARLIKKLMPELDSRHVDELGAMLDVDGDGQVSFNELLSSIKEAYAARMAAKTGRGPELNSQLERVRQVLRNDRKVAQEAWSSADSDHDGCLYHMEVLGLFRKLLKGITQKEVRYLLAKLQEWDIMGEAKASWNELLQALELVRIYRVGPGQAGKAVPMAPGRAKSPGRTQPIPFTARQNKTSDLKEGFLRERVVQLEAELAGAAQREDVLQQDAQRVEVMRRDLAQARARIEDLEKDFARLDVLFRVDAAAASGDQQLHAAWEAAATFKKRYLEHKAELDAIRLTAARMQAQLDETHKLLATEHKQRFKLEDDVSRLNMELGRVQGLEARLAAERAERVKLEKEYLTLQSTALSAPGAALGEVRGLREEVFSLRRDKALAEQKEAEVRRELSHVREQLDGMSVDQYKAWQRDYHDLKKAVSSLQLDLQAANDKLDVYRRTENAGVSGIVYGAKQAPAFLDRRPDVDKNEDEVRRELAQLRDVWHADQLELKKLHQVLEVESGQTLEAKAALEDAHKEMDRLRRDLQDQLKNIQRELDRRDERIRKLELQLRGAYSGINRALRSSRMRDSRATDAPDDMSELGDDQNLLELHISEATLYEEMLGREPSTFCTFDFYLHDTQATPVLASNNPTFDTLVQYVVDADTFLVQYLETHIMEMELNKARGWDYDPVGVARIPLRQILEDVEIGAALGHNRAYHYADIYGADGRRIGRVRYGFSFRKPLDNLLRDYRLQARNKQAAVPDARDAAAAAVTAAQTTPAAVAHVKVVVARCEGLVAPSGAGSNCRPYVWFRFPGHREPHSTRMLYGLNPVYEDESVWLLARSAELEQNFRTREMEFVVFDEAAGEDPVRGIIGVAFVPLASLAQGIPVEGAFKIINPVSKQPAGKLILGMGWHNPLALPGGAACKTAPSAGVQPTRQSSPGPMHSLATSPAVMYGTDAARAGSAAPAGLLQPATGLAGPVVAPPVRSLAANLPQFPPRRGTAATAPPNQYGLAEDVNALQQQQDAAAGRYVPPRIPADRFDIPAVGGATPNAALRSPSPEPLTFSQSPMLGQQQPATGSVAGGNIMPGNMLLPGPGLATGAAGRARYGPEVEQSASPPPLSRPAYELQAPSSVFRQLPVDTTQWPAEQQHLLLSVESVTLDATNMLDASFTHVFVMHALLEEAVTRLEDTCTPVVPIRQGALNLGYAAAYRISGDASATLAGSCLTKRLTAKDGAYLDLKLFATRSATLDLAGLQTGFVRSVGSAEVSLLEMVAGRQGDLTRAQVVLLHEETGQRVGTLTLTFKASAALRTVTTSNAPALQPVPNAVSAVSASTYGNNTSPSSTAYGTAMPPAYGSLQAAAGHGPAPAQLPGSIGLPQPNNAISNDGVRAVGGGVGSTLQDMPAARKW